MRGLTLRIRQARRKSGLSQTALAEGLQVNRSAVAQWERAGGTRPNAENMARLAVALHVSFEWLATGRGRIHEAGEQSGEHALLLNHYAHDELEERLLFAVRRLEYWQARVVLEMVEGFAQGRLDGPVKKRKRKGSLED